MVEDIDYGDPIPVDQDREIRIQLIIPPADPFEDLLVVRVVALNLMFGKSTS